jgi:type IV pilus assembly protein PilV
VLKKSNSGFSLLEVMISFLVVSIALIALLTAQLRSLQYVNDSFNYTVSLIQANNVVERILPHLCELQHTNPDLYKDIDFQQSLQPQSDYYTLTLPVDFPSTAPYDIDVIVAWKGKQLDVDLENEIKIVGSFPVLPSGCAA